MPAGCTAPGAPGREFWNPGLCSRIQEKVSLAQAAWFKRFLPALFWCSLLAAGVTAWAAPNIRLYLKDGGYHLVREYQVNGDRVRYYSVERSEWEEVPLELIDLARTTAEENRIEAEHRERDEEDRIEKQAEKEARLELQRVPLDDGVYWLDGDQAAELKQAEPQRKTDKRRSVLKAAAPFPLIAGKATIELAGPRAIFVVNTPSPQFYVRLDNVRRLALCRLTPRRESRIVEDLTIAPVVKQVTGEAKEVELFRQQLAPTVYKIWPVEPLQPGEYAVVQFLEEKSELEYRTSLQAWDFAYRKP